VSRVVVVGAGVGGLTAAAVLARAGLDVTVLEAHVYPGGCAGTFYHKGYRFDAGATLAGGFYSGGPMDLVAQAAGVDRWPAHPTNPALVVHLPDGCAVARRTDAQRWDEHRRAFGPQAEAFWHWQERTADAMWDFALQTPPWPPQTPIEVLQLGQKGLTWLKRQPASYTHLPQLAADAFRPVAAHLRHLPERLRLFVDGQLLIAAQATSRTANALYGASALDLPRRGVVHLEGGMGALAETLAQAVRQNGGQVYYRQEVSRIVVEQGRPVAVETRRGKSFPADLVVANLPPWNVAALFPENPPGPLSSLAAGSPRLLASFDGWGAFMVYVGVDNSAVPTNFPLHHQVIVREPLAEGNTLLLSLSPPWDRKRGPTGHRALTISTHTRLGDWWHLFEQDRAAYEARKAVYAGRMLAAAETVLPGLRAAANLILPGTPVTFQRFTRRTWGWVGGFPQTSLFRAWGPRLAPGLWLVGDSIFPGQSTAAVALGGLHVARTILSEPGTPALAYEVSTPRLTRTFMRTDP
jgi:C-3',4' desaturase CrtD